MDAFGSHNKIIAKDAILQHPDGREIRVVTSTDAQLMPAVPQPGMFPGFEDLGLDFGVN